MKTMKETIHKTEPRVRFNWGYHDAAKTAREGCDNAEYNFGFAHGTMTLTCPEDVSAQHFDSVYATGWSMGYLEALAIQMGAQGNTDSSEDAWQAALAGERVTTTNRPHPQTEDHHMNAAILSKLDEITTMFASMSTIPLSAIGRLTALLESAPDKALLGIIGPGRNCLLAILSINQQLAAPGMGGNDDG